MVINSLSGGRKKINEVYHRRRNFRKTRDISRNVNSDDTLNILESNRKVPERYLRRATNPREYRP